MRVCYYKCDRCGKPFQYDSFFKRDDLGFKLIRVIIRDEEEEDLDICDDCQRELEEWFDKAERRDNENENFENANRADASQRKTI